MVQVQKREALSHDSTIYLLSQVPSAVCNEVIQGLTGNTHSFEHSDNHLWRISNKYYSAQVQFTLFDSALQLQEALKQAGRPETPALVILVDNSKAVDESILQEFETDQIDVPLVVGTSTTPSRTAVPWEDMVQQCISLGWEYVDASDTGEDEEEYGGQSGMARLSEALQAHIWPTDQVKKSNGSASVANDDDTKEDDAVPEASTSSQFRRRRDSDASSRSDDAFAPFVSATAGNTVLAGSPDSASSSPMLLHQESLDYSLFPGRQPKLDEELSEDGGEDPASHLADMFANFVGLREKAMGMSDREDRINFAEDVAMKFAKQLDLLIGDDEDEEGPVKDDRKDEEDGASVQAFSGLPQVGESNHATATATDVTAEDFEEVSDRKEAMSQI